MTKQELALEIIERLKKEYPDADCTLDYDQAWKLLVSVRLAAQCTDARVNVVVEKLYEKYPDVNALAAATPEEIEEIVRPCGLGRSKARDISACMKILWEEYDGRVPEDFEALFGEGKELTFVKELSQPGQYVAAEKLGMRVFLLTDCLINKDGRDISCYPQGGFSELMAYIMEGKR